MKKIITSILAVCAVVIVTLAQHSRHVPGELLVQADKASLMAVLGEKSGQLNIEKCLSPHMGIWKITFDPNVIKDDQALQFFKKHPLISEAQFNHKVYLRDTLPNDSLINDQWQYVNDGSNGGLLDADLDADQAWDITTGGLTFYGDTIVVCVVDDGIDTNHIDFEDNLWVNHDEIPGNGIDDDTNGYIDDYYGWNIADNNDSIHGGSHGTPVSGIIGAKGNNGIGVSGINWNVKVMVVKNDFDTDEAAVIEAYSYPLAMRRLYNQTNGAKGAFVVATNSSWGIDTGLPSEAPLWCAFYDSLGAEGVLSCGATANWDYNVDVDGDLPTACSSPYLISVTNVDRTDEKVTYAGFGKTTIDLGAYGEGTYTTDFGNTYAGFGGTSGATPHVAGAVALLYSVQCQNFADIVQNQPGQAALLIKEVIMSQVEPNTSLENITVTGGRLNLYNSVKYLNDFCDSVSCSAPFSILVTDTTDSTATVSWSALKDTAINFQYRNVKDAGWIEINDSSVNVLTITDLESCQDYEARIRTRCDNGWSEYSIPVYFKTGGCGACTSDAYCALYSSNYQSAYIANVELNTLSRSSTSKNGIDENLSIWTKLLGEEEYTLEITPGYGTVTEYDVFTSVWIDYDQDGTFNDSTELVFSMDSATTERHSGKVVVHPKAKTGVTRMRIAMKYPNAPSPCQLFSIGEVEDYCVEIDNSVGVTDNNEVRPMVQVYPNPGENTFNIALPDYTESNLLLTDITGKQIWSHISRGSAKVKMQLEDDVEPGVYLLKVVQSGKTYINRIIKR